MFATMTVNGLYRNFLKELKTMYDDHEADRITSMVFESIGITRAILIKEPEQVMDDKMVLRIKEGLASLKLNKPVQYVLGEAWFYRMKLKVSPAVLIPRPETEELADAAIVFLRNKHAADVLDIGTGSGCIALAVKKNSPAVSVTAIDMSEEALRIAKENSVEHLTEIKFLSVDFLEEKNWEQLGKYDVIVSNPPYIPLSELDSLDKNVTDYEPHKALFVGNDNPLIFYEKIARFGTEHLKKDGKIFLETHENFAEEVCTLFIKHSYEAAIKKDMFDKHRMVIATHCH